MKYFVMIEINPMDSVPRIIQALRVSPRIYFPVSKPSLDQINLFLLGIMIGQDLALVNKKIDFSILRSFSSFVDKKLGSNRKVVNDWWVEIRLHYPENQMEKFFELWDEFRATQN